MTAIPFYNDLIVCILNLILPPKNEDDKQTAEFLANRLHETWVYLQFNSSHLDRYLAYLRQQLELSDAVNWTELLVVAERMEEHLDAKDLLDAGLEQSE